MDQQAPLHNIPPLQGWHHSNQIQTPKQMPADTFLETEMVLDLLKCPLPGAAKSNIRNISI
jgi:hypothetical protein